MMWFLQLPGNMKERVIGRPMRQQIQRPAQFQYTPRAAQVRRSGPCAAMEREAVPEISTPIRTAQTKKAARGQPLWEQGNQSQLRAPPV